MRTFDRAVGILSACLAVAACSDPSAKPMPSGTGGAGGGTVEPEVCHAQPDHKPVSIVGGDRTMLAVMDDGTLYCWRENTTGQCDADEFGLLFNYPVRVPNLPCVTKAAAGDVGIAITRGGRALTWGIGAYGERGAGDTSPPPTEPFELPFKGVTDVSANASAMGLVAESQVYWWGELQERATAPTRLAAGVATRVHVDPATSCLLQPQGSVECWGKTNTGALGEATSSTASPVAIVLPDPARVLSVSQESICAVIDDRTIHCWGSNRYGTLGLGDRPGDFDPHPADLPIDADSPFDGIALGSATACAWRPSGEVLCWGANYLGKYAPEDGASSSLPRRVPELEPAKQVAVVYDEVCALGFDDVIRCRIPQPDPAMPHEARVLDFINPPPGPK